MTAPSASTDSVREEAKLAWERNAEFWDRSMGDGNSFQRLLLGPATEALLEIRPGARVLDLACGNGHVSRRLVELGAKVVAADFSDALLECARRRLAGVLGDVELRRVDATSADELEAVAREERFDGVLCNMALMDMAEIEPLARTLPRMLKEGGRFVFSVMHPAFNNDGLRLCIEEEDKNGALVVDRHVKIRSYATPSISRGLGMEGQPVPHLYFHRPLGALLAPFLEAGLSLDALREPSFPPDTPAERPFSWVSFREIPPVLVARLRVSG
jgi:2-polyprenyl-3-methyl-5-hydroxy-6-metoxy-1,4-benzoquinol methylase